MTHSDKTAVADQPARTTTATPAQATSDPATRDTTTPPSATPTGPSPRDGTKLAILIAALRAPEGATIAELTAATGWQAHSVRGAMAGILKKKLGLTVTSAKIDGRGRVYALASGHGVAGSTPA